MPALYGAVRRLSSTAGEPGLCASPTVACAVKVLQYIITELSFSATSQPGVPDPACLQLLVDAACELQPVVVRHYLPPASVTSCSTCAAQVFGNMQWHASRCQGADGEPQLSQCATGAGSSTPGVRNDVHAGMLNAAVRINSCLVVGGMAMAGLSVAPHG
jgi:hypothetical protein